MVESNRAKEQHLEPLLPLPDDLSCRAILEGGGLCGELAHWGLFDISVFWAASGLWVCAPMIPLCDRHGAQWQRAREVSVEWREEDIGRGAIGG